MATETHPAPRRKKQAARKASETERSGIPANSDAPVSPASPFIEPERRHAMICDAAYFLAERRDFCPGHELDDWLAAEHDVDRQPDSASASTRRGT